MASVTPSGDAIRALIGWYQGNRSIRIEGAYLQIALSFEQHPVGRIHARDVSLNDDTLAVQELRRLREVDADFQRLRECPGCLRYFFDESMSRRARYCNQVPCRQARDRDGAVGTRI